MKLAAFLFVLALLFAAIAPRLGEIFSSSGIQLPQFIWSKSPPRVYHFDFANVARVISVILFLSAALAVLLSWRSHK